MYNSPTNIAFSPFSGQLDTIFTFQSLPTQLPPLKFKGHCHRRAPKRSRPAADVDDLVSESKKKRRLRLVLITSRLSRPFSTPATHCVDKGSSKIAVWAKQRQMVPQVLRKAAIMNRVRRKTLERKDSGISMGSEECSRDAIREGLLSAASLGDGLGPNAVAMSQLEREDWSANPSPLGLSNYDALDDEDDYYESYHEEDQPEDSDFAPASSIKQMAPPPTYFDTNAATAAQRRYYSDFNFFEVKAARSDGEQSDSDDDDPFHLNVLPSDIIKERRPPSPPEDKDIELMKEKQRQKEITSGFLHFA